DIPFIMTGHILFPHVDSRPASLSPTWVQTILRREIGYDGIIVTDDIKMGALGTTPAQSALLALQAGNDMVIAVVDEQTLQHITTELSAYYAHPDHQQELSGKLLRILASKYRFLATKSDT
ncbi:MAG: glycoside hydrolase family 3 N-terminal domain-containing protein, partial [Candidatus Dojkabacteria bacterium]|nr:glycoside hydrolase family 3 N-terminal domain-containing protein [Candidatus Dojkabacteria bacterium]